MYVFKQIDKSSTFFQNNVVNYTQNLTTSSAGIKSINIISGSVSQSYWESLNVLFYTSGSPRFSGENKFSQKTTNFSLVKAGNKKQHLNKYHGYPSSSLISIPQQYYGEKIKPKSFELTGLDYTDNNSVNPIIKDDGNGNLYSTNAHHSQSTNNASSSENYIGNIFYERGVVVITETGSWSGSVNYSQLTNDKNFKIKLDSFDRIGTKEYSVTLLPKEFNHSMNYTLRAPLSGSVNSIGEFSSSLLSTPYLAEQFTGSDFQPYITSINLYQEGDNDIPVMVAKLPYPIRKSKKIATTFKIRLDI
tara:strand:+ start:1002 stop:1913 length:912 start_codon:yes stop_codon:yes gene_type:complete